MNTLKKCNTSIDPDFWSSIIIFVPIFGSEVASALVLFLFESMTVYGSKHAVSP